MKLISGLVFLLLSFTTNIAFADSWGSWTEISRGIDWRVKCGDYNDSARKYHWSYEIRNRFQSTANVQYTVHDRRGNDDRGGMTLRAGETDSSWALLAVKCGGAIAIRVRGVEVD